VLHYLHMDIKNPKTNLWWNYLAPDLKELFLESLLLLEKTKQWNDKFHDYSFVVFPAAKAYEGVLKHIFLDLGFIDKIGFLDKHFRIGKSLNPSLDRQHQGRDWVYDDLAKHCQGKDLPDKLWETWKHSRNLAFHWFPGEKNSLSLPQAEERLSMIFDAIDAIFRVCRININDKIK